MSLTAHLRELANTLERTKLRFDQSKMSNPLAGAQQRRWYERERPEIVAAIRRHGDAIAALFDANSTESGRDVNRRCERTGEAETQGNRHETAGVGVVVAGIPDK